MAKPINLLFVLWTWMGRRKQKFNRICQVAPWEAYWRQLGNMIELSVCSGDSALCQITLTTCLHI